VGVNRAQSVAIPGLTAKENWVQRVVADSYAICILQSARLRLPVSSHGLSKASLERELVIATISGSITPVEMPKIAQLASMHEWK
jgi:hypothetical protein